MGAHGALDLVIDFPAGSLNAQDLLHLHYVIGSRVVAHHAQRAHDSCQVPTLDQHLIPADNRSSSA